jgi:predicted regulator of Ras-like GTPase activity (Roadblock/LC7/MglB family)
VSSTNPLPRFAADLRARAHALLEKFVTENSGIQLAVLTSADGFEVAAHPVRPMTQKIAAMSSSLQALSEAIAREAGLVNSRNLVVESENGTIVVLGLANTTPRLSLAVVGGGDEILGRLLWLARNCAGEIDRALKT